MSTTTDQRDELAKALKRAINHIDCLIECLEIPTSTSDIEDEIEQARSFKERWKI